MRTIVDLPDEQVEALKNLQKRLRLSRAELVRRAVANYVSQNQPAQDDSAFGVWSKRAEDGLKYQVRIPYQIT